MQHTWGSVQLQRQLQRDAALCGWQQVGRHGRLACAGLGHRAECCRRPAAILAPQRLPVQHLTYEAELSWSASCLRMPSSQLAVLRVYLPGRDRRPGNRERSADWANRRTAVEHQGIKA